MHKTFAKWWDVEILPLIWDKFSAKQHKLVRSIAEATWSASGTASTNEALTHLNRLFAQFDTPCKVDATAEAILDSGDLQ